MLIPFVLSMSILLVEQLGIIFGLLKSFSMVAFLIIALRCMVKTLIVVSQISTVVLFMANCSHVVAMSTSTPVAVVVSSDVLSIVYILTSSRVNAVVHITTVVGLRVIMTVRVLAAVLIAKATASVMVVGIVCVLSGEQVNDTIAIEERITRFLVITVTSSGDITTGFAGFEELESFGSAAGVTTINIDLEARIILKVFTIELKILLIFEIKLMVSANVEVVIAEMSLNVVFFILETIDLAIGELSFKAKVLFKAIYFVVDALVFDVEISVNAGDFHLICLDFDAILLFHVLDIIVGELNFKTVVVLETRSLVVCKFAIEVELVFDAGNISLDALVLNIGQVFDLRGHLLYEF